MTQMNKLAIFFVLVIAIGVAAIVSGLAGEQIYQLFMSVVRKLRF